MLGAEERMMRKVVHMLTIILCLKGLNIYY